MERKRRRRSSGKEIKAGSRPSQSRRSDHSEKPTPCPMCDVPDRTRSAVSTSTSRRSHRLVICEWNETCVYDWDHTTAPQWRIEDLLCAPRSIRAGKPAGSDGETTGAMRARPGGAAGTATAHCQPAGRPCERRFTLVGGSYREDEDARM
jgi:hypothetical protein